jgi:hypothetical protein
VKFVEARLTYGVFQQTGEAEIREISPDCAQNTSQSPLFQRKWAAAPIKAPSAEGRLAS